MITFGKKLLAVAGVASLLATSADVVYAETFLTVDQAKQLIWQDRSLRRLKVTLSDEQVESIEDASDTIVRNKNLNVWRTLEGDWFILDQVIGKHENIDVAVGLYADGSVKGIEILTYRETYGGQVRNPKWLAQFIGRTHKEHLKLDEQIRNISGATLSCRHITDGINRLTHTWQQVLQHADD